MNLVNNISEDKNFKLNLPLSWPRDFKMSTSSYQKYWLWSLFILWSTLVWNTSCLAKCWLPGALKDIKLPSLYLQMEGLCLLKVQSQLSLSCPSSTWLSFSSNRKETRIVSDFASLPKSLSSGFQEPEIMSMQPLNNKRSVDFSAAGSLQTKPCYNTTYTGWQQQYLKEKWSS